MKKINKNIKNGFIMPGIGKWQSTVNVLILRFSGDVLYEELRANFSLSR